MATSLGLIILLGLLSSKLFTRLKLPGLLGMIIIGAILGPFGLKILSPDIIHISADLRSIALIVILLRAGLGLKKDDLMEVGKPAIKLSFIPGLLEGFTILFLSIVFFNFTFVQGGILGFILAAVSPAVVVPAMLNLMDKGLGRKKNIPTLILAGASIDDVFAITIFSAFLGIYSGDNISISRTIFQIPLSIILGILFGSIVGLVLVRIFKKFAVQDSKIVLYLLSLSILIISFENLVQSKLQIAGLLGVMALGFIIAEKMPGLGTKLSSKFNNIWVFAQILLFVLVGAQVDLSLALDAGLKGIILISLGLFARSIGVLLALLGSNLNLKERIFCVIAYFPKATVQAAIGGIPLTLGVESGDLILSLAVLSIVITSPLGAIAINKAGPRLLE